jgi:hypothetical protein
MNKKTSIGKASKTGSSAKKITDMDKLIKKINIQIKMIPINMRKHLVKNK